MASIHDRIKALRERKQWSMEQLGAVVGVSWQTVQQWENGKTAPKRARATKVAEALGVSVQDLLYGEPSGIPDENIDAQASQKTIDQLFRELAARVVAEGVRTAESAPGHLQYEIGKLLDQISAETAGRPQGLPTPPKELHSS